MEIHQVLQEEADLPAVAVDHPAVEGDLPAVAVDHPAVVADLLVVAVDLLEAEAAKWKLHLS